MPDHMKQRLTDLIGELQPCDADVRWVRTGSMHATLKFLGDVEPAAVGTIDESLRKVAAAAAPTNSRLRNLGSFPHLRRPRVLWIGLQTDERLTALQEAVEEALATLGFGPEERRYHPHITLGRVRGSRGSASLREAIETRDDVDLGTIRIDSMTLFESRLGRGGARYTALGKYTLSGH